MSVATRARVARKLVDGAAWPIDRDYMYYHGHVKRRRMEQAFCLLTRRPGWRLLKLAVKIDRCAAGDQMVLHGWWG